MKKVSFIAAAVLVATTASAQTPPADRAAGSRLLASNCFQCHGTDGRGSGSFERLAGKSAAEIYKELREMKAKNQRGDIMTVHAAGYSDAQLQAIADYFSQQPR